MLKVIYIRPLDLSVDETVYAIVGTVSRTSATGFANRSTR